jgi:transcriptional regulator with XRE-family HTH domain
MITGEQIRAARAIARWSQADLAARAQLSLETIKRLEGIHGPVVANRRTLAALEAAFASAGIVLDDGGVSLVRPAAGAPAADLPEPTQPLVRLIYHSRMRGDDEQTLNETLRQILACSRRNNPAHAVTGALLAADQRFLQVLEGPEDGVAKVYGRIARDPRHEDVVVLERRTVPARHFSKWSLCCGYVAPANTALEAEPELRAGLASQALSPAAALGLLLVVQEVAQTSTLESDAGPVP